MRDVQVNALPPLDGLAIKTLENALVRSPSKSVVLEINNALYQLSREGHWFRFSLLTKKRSPKRSTLFATITDVYNQAMHGHKWRIADCAI